ncbi:7-helix-1 protein [Plasmodium brasilianum]|uniref:G-protein coupled receptor n=2 Tax=Plasmodium (Plasmodium) TaxID=418103 RepID=A0A1A8VZW9_PLAMA|nr:G-protein coupled receptor, putative [Plasmodium malariae]KAI4837727.1 7-helix-1 protein [Plasmodium brasilianum]SBS86157.1 G-protein coupled receptor [Plasmodium malariae]SCN44680.1 G-protein coupled receptor, putative [Plasmodium malariae]
MMEGNNRYISKGYLEEFEENDNNVVLIKKKINEYSSKLNNELKEHRSQSIYCGIGGILYMDLLLYECNENITYLELGYNIIKSIHKYKGKNAISFLEGDIGIYSLSSVVHYYLENETSVNNNIELLVNHMIDNKEELTSVNSECELLYGKCGYIYSFLFCKNIWMNSKYKNTILINLYRIMNSIFDYGLLNGNTMFPITSLSLYFEWHEQIYLGAAHGYAGIFFVLFKLILFFSNNLKDLCTAIIIQQNDKKKYIYNNIDENEFENSKNHVVEKLNEYIQLIYKVTDEILTHYISKEYNIYSSIKKDKNKKKNDTLIQWCHGNVGFIILLIELLKYNYVPTFFCNKYNKQFIERMGLLLWERGLLYKGFGLCHGISGNGMIFLYLYNYTNDKHWYIKALKYALFSIKYFDKFYTVPDRPDSLFEGYAALVVFLIFLLKPHLTYFPGYDIPSDFPSPKGVSSR